MESPNSSVLLIVLLTIATILLLYLLLRRNRGGNRGLPPGPPGLPVLGRLPFLTSDLHRCFANISQSYGPISSFWVGWKLFVVVSSPSTAREVLKDRDAIFANRSPPLLSSIAVNGLDIVWSPYGSHWRMARKVVVRELLNPTVLHSFRTLRQREVHRVIARTRPHEATSVRDMVSSVGLWVIFGMIMDGALRDGEGGLTHLAEELRELIDKMLALMGSPNLSDFFPVLAPLDLQGLQRRMRALVARFDTVIDAILEQKVRSGGGSKENANHNKDFLQLLLDLADGRDPEVPLKFDHIAPIILDLVSGSVDTTSATIEWAMAELMRKPEMMAKLQEELDFVVGENGILEESHLPNLRYLDAAVKETFRLHPVVPLLVPRTPSTSSTIGGYNVPTGATVSVNVWAIQRDPSLWDKPLEFMPERFLPADGNDHEDDKWDYSTRKSFDYLPFGRGRRTCPGIDMGERMVTLILGTFLHSLNWALPGGTTTLDLDDKYFLVLQKKDPLLLLPSIRRKQYFSIGG